MTAKDKGGKRKRSPLQGGKHTAKSSLHPVYPAHGNRAKAHAQNRTKRTTPKGPTIKCAICGKSYARITHTHLKSHNLTIEQYLRTFGGSVSPAPALPRPAPGLGTGERPDRHADCYGAPLPVLPRASEAGLAVAQQLLKDGHFVRRLADEAAHVIFTTSLRDQFRLALCSVLSARLELHGRAVASLQTLRAELDQPWRREAGGGPDGEPTPTPHLLGMAAQAHAEVTKAEDALLRAVKMAADEATKNKAAMAAFGGKPAFTGEAEAIPVPPSLSPAERETVRSLLGLLKDEMSARASSRALPFTPGEGPEEGDEPEVALEAPALVEEAPPASPGEATFVDPFPLA